MIQMEAQQAETETHRERESFPDSSPIALRRKAERTSSPFLHEAQGLLFSFPKPSDLVSRSDRENSLHRTAPLITTGDTAGTRGYRDLPTSHSKFHAAKRSSGIGGNNLFGTTHNAAMPFRCCQHSSRITRRDITYPVGGIWDSPESDTPSRRLPEGDNPNKVVKLPPDFTRSARRSPKKVRDGTEKRVRHQAVSEDGTQPPMSGHAPTTRLLCAILSAGQDKDKRLVGWSQGKRKAGRHAPLSHN